MCVYICGMVDKVGWMRSEADLCNLLRSPFIHLVYLPAHKGHSFARVFFDDVRREGHGSQWRPPYLAVEGRDPADTAIVCNS